MQFQSVHSIIHCVSVYEKQSLVKMVFGEGICWLRWLANRDATKKTQSFDS